MVFGGMRRRGGSWVRASAGGAILLGLALSLAFAQGEKETKSDVNHRKDAPKRAETSAKPEIVSSDPQVTTAAFGDWVERCEKLGSGSDAPRVCEVAETVQVEGQAAPIAQLAIGRVRKTDPLRLTLMLPVNVAFPSAPRLALGGSGGVDLTWRRCIPAGCIAEATVSDADIAAFRAAAQTGHVETRTSLGQDLKFAISFRGLAQSLDALARED